MNFPYYPMQYQDQLSQLRANPMPYQRQENGLNWVQGETGAKSWFVAPGSTVLLMDSEAQRFYLKSADVNGVPGMRIFEYSEVTAPKPAGQYVTLDEFNAFRQDIMSRLTQKGEVNE